jgi:hypothetical protein
MRRLVVFGFRGNAFIGFNFGNLAKKLPGSLKEVRMKQQTAAI